MGKIREKLEREGITEFSPMQQASFDAILNTSADVVILSPTGTGKTLSYLIPLLQLVDKNSEDVQAVVIVPNRELALQSSLVAQSLDTGVRSMACYGGKPTMDEHREMMKIRPHLLFATPGRLKDHLEKQNFSVGFIHFFIIDEFDKCLQEGFLEEMKSVVGQLPHVSRTILLSATDAEEIPGFINLSNVERVDFLPETPKVTEQITTFLVKSPDKDKLETLKKLLLTFEGAKTIVFVNFRESVERVSNYLSEKGFSMLLFHGGLEQKNRELTLSKFFNDSANILVSTNLASRGIDFPDVVNIVHYHLPETRNDYLHRIGRTARWNGKGNSYFILGPAESMPEYVEEDINGFDFPDSFPGVVASQFVTLYIGKGKKDKISKGDVVGFLCKQGGLKAEDIGAIDVRKYYTHVAVARKKAAQAVTNANGEKIKGVKTVVEFVD